MSKGASRKIKIHKSQKGLYFRVDYLASTMFMVHLCFVLLVAHVCALPAGGACSKGVECTSQGLEMCVEAKAERTIIDWETFFIGRNERVIYDLPSKNAAVLNRVVGGQESQILGRIDANQGSIYLVNPNGIFISKDAVINVSSLIASTFRVTNEDFFKGKDIFFGTSKAHIVHEGTIEASCGTVTLIASYIEGSGKIQADEILLVGGNGVMIRAPVGDKKGFYEQAINHAPEEKPSLHCENGRYFIRGSSGKISVGGEFKAERVDIVAKEVDLLSGAEIEARFASLGAPGLTERTVVGAGAFVRGHKILVWGDRLAHVRGELFAPGGIVEVSRAPIVDEAEIVTAGGYLIIDPPDITITAASSSIGVSETGGDYSFSGNATPLNINAKTLGNLLASNDVVIKTTAGSSTADGSGSITVGTENGADLPIVQWASNHNLTLQASSGGAIQINEGINATGWGGLTLIAKDITIGKSNHSHTNGIDLSIGGDLTVAFSEPVGSFGIYTGVNKEALVKAQGMVAVARAQGMTGLAGDLMIESGACTNPQNATLSSLAHSMELDVGNITVQSSGLDASIQAFNDATIKASGNCLVQTGGSGRQAYICATMGVADITADSLTISNSCTIAPQTKYAHGAFISADGGVEILTQGPILIQSEHVGTSGFVSTADGAFTIKGCSQLSILNTSSSDMAYVSLASSGMNPSTIQTSGAIVISVGQAGQEAFIASDSDLTITAGGDISVTNSNTAWKGVAAIASYGHLSLGTSGKISVVTTGLIDTAYIMSDDGANQVKITQCAGIEMDGGAIGGSGIAIPP